MAPARRLAYNPAPHDTTDLPAVPARVRSLDGQLVETAKDCWTMRVSSDGGHAISIRWAKLQRLDQPCCYTRRAEHLVRLYLADRLTRKKASTIHNDFGTFLYFEDWLRTDAGVHQFDWGDLNERLGTAFLSHGLKHTAEKGNRFSRLRTFYEWGVARQHSDFDMRVLRLLQSITAIGNAKGHHVRFRHPTKGPFSPDELLLIRNAIDAGNGSEKDRALVMLHLELGHNPSATARLKNSDLIRYEAAMLIRYHLDVPRVKKRTAHRETKRRPISNKLGILLESLQAGSSGDPLIHWLPGISPDSSITHALRRFARSSGLVSPRTLKPLVVNARRFRFSTATHMAEEGASLFHIAEILDHTDTQNVRVYVETVSSIADPVAKATDAALAPLVRRFQGKIVDASETQIFDGLPNQMIPAAAPHLGIVHLNAGGVGMCGRDVRKDGLCRLLPPVSCYLCPSFAALRDGPHQEMLDSMEAFLRESEATSDRRIQMQLDEVRVAIQQVIRQVREQGA
jgi:Phage integrase family